MKNFLSLLAVLLLSTESSAQINFTHVTDQPVFSYGASGGWDAGAVWNPTIIKDGDTLRMWYTALPKSVWMSSSGKIGYAESLDGTKWNRFAGNPVLAADLSWESKTIYGCAVIKDGTTFKMWYGAGGTPAKKVGYATSVDGINWIKHPNPVLAPDPSPNWGDDIIAPHTVIKEEGTYKMWYWAGKFGFPDEASLPQIGLATSSDGINWVKYNDPATTEPELLTSDPVLKVGAPGEWDMKRVIQPMVMRTDSGYEMWYVGSKLTSVPPQTIGYATSTDGITWTKLSLNPILSTTPGWSKGALNAYYGGTILKLIDTYHFWYSCFHTPPTEARPQIGYATSLVGNK